MSDINGTALCAVLLGAIALFSSPAARTDETKPSPVATAVIKAMGPLRADDDMLQLLNAHANLNPDSIEKLDVATARRNPTIADAVNVVLKQRGQSSAPEELVPGIESRDISIQGAVGDLPARIYAPAGAGPFPVVVYFHGGGWVLADKQVYDGGARGLSKSANALVISVDYRLAPENKFPAAWDDALASYKWTLTHAAKYHGDAEKVALAGESAGGNLALATAIAARDAGMQRPAHVLAVYPVTQTDRETVSYLENAIAVPLNRAMMKWFFDKVIRTEADLKDPRLQLTDARLEGLPSVTLITARIDPLRSDGAKMAEALRKAGVPVELKDYEGVTHEFFGAAAVVAKAHEAQTYAGTRLVAAFSD